MPIADEPVVTTAAEDALAKRVSADQRRLAANPEPSHDCIVCGAGPAGMTRRNRAAAATLLLAAGLFAPAAACAHVKWFAPYIVGAPPRPVGATLRDGWFWLGIALALAFFIGARLVERGAWGAAALDGLDRLTRPVWGRLDDCVRAIVAAFFVAVFSVGGVYLTPDLKTPAEWVSWMQLLIAAAVFWRATMPLAGAGAGIVALWLLALRDYDLFHLFDYLALGLGVAAYLVLAARPPERWRAHRFEALRWGLAAALMWSSLEKFAYPAWFHPLVVEKPYLTFGLPRDAFIPMAGIAEFTLGFGLLWTPLVRRLSAVALFAIFTSAVWPFGRIEIIGHGLIMAMLLAVAADQSRHPLPLAAFKAPLRNIPVGLAVALALSASSYWGLHVAFYGPDGHAGPATAELATHSGNPEHPHGPTAEGGIGAPPARGREARWRAAPGRRGRRLAPAPGPARTGPHAGTAGKGRAAPRPPRAAPARHPTAMRFRSLQRRPKAPSGPLAHLAAVGRRRR